MSHMGEHMIRRMNDDMEREHGMEREVSRALHEQEEQELSRMFSVGDEEDYIALLKYPDFNGGVGFAHHTRTGRTKSGRKRS